MRTVLVCSPAAAAFGRAMGAALAAENASCHVVKFADGEMEVTVQPEALAGARVLIVQTFLPAVHDGVMELALMADAARRAGAAEVVAVLPYMAYSRQDRAAKPGVAVSAGVLARILEACGFFRVVTVEVHSPRVAGNYHVVFESVGVMEAMAKRAAKVLRGERVCVVSPDAGGMERAEAFAAVLEKEGLEVNVAMVEKRRDKANEVASARLLGNVKDCHCVLVDDMIDTAGTLCAAAEVVREGGARGVSASAVHGLFNGKALDRLLLAGFEHLWVSDTLPLREEMHMVSGLEAVPVAEVVAKVLRN